MQRPEAHTIPLSPGVYLYSDSNGRVLYVGKARVLRRRVLSYFREDIAPKTRAMLSHAHSISYLTTTTEKEALLLEASLIKKHRPHYNIVLRDDKQYVLFRLAPKQAFPRLEVVRTAKKDGARYFGPFTSGLAARETWKLLHRAFGLRRCTDRAMKNRVRPCLYHHIGQCPAPCAGLISKEAYHATVEQVLDVLSGNAKALLAELEKNMLAAADALDFERAAQLRDQMRAVQNTVERQAAVLPSGGDMDVAGIAAGEKGLALALLFMRKGAITDGHSFYWHGLSLDDAPDVMLSFLSQYYIDRMPPPRIVLPWLPDNAPALGLIAESLGEKRGAAVRILAPRDQQSNQLVDVAIANAQEEIRQRSTGTEDVASKLQQLLHLAAPPQRIECVDVSHTGGRQTRVGMVVFEDGLAATSQYRLYTMPDNLALGGGDDYATLAAWVTRRLDSGAPWPDLLLIDGGRGQVSAVAGALAAAGKADLFPLAGIAKARDDQGHADRRAGNVADRIFVPNRVNPLPFKEGSAELLLLQHIRDCTHHFAISGHRKARTGAALQGELTRLAGIGTATATLLWQAFGSVAAMRAASEEDLRRLKGIGKAKAQAIKKKLEALA
ncbi:MAG: excinuclease ABC subunit UvrC [Desulfovibrionaceae bacterium]|nr:excinuclease ABC subunit UvrC [Desulfovibrionaceae bacterium]